MLIIEMGIINKIFILRIEWKFEIDFFFRIIFPEKDWNTNPNIALVTPTSAAIVDFPKMANRTTIAGIDE